MEKRAENFGNNPRCKELTGLTEYHCDRGVSIHYNHGTDTLLGVCRSWEIQDCAHVHVESTQT